LEADIYLGLSGLELNFSEMEFGQGIVLRKTYACLMSPYLMAFRPVKPETHYGGPWKGAEGGKNFDVTAELYIPATCNSRELNTFELGKLVVALMRLWISPDITNPVISNISFSLAASAKDNHVTLVPVETHERYIKFKTETDGSLSEDAFLWLKEHWNNVTRLASKYNEFKLALDVLDEFHFQKSQAMNIVSLWGALEALFLKQKYELRFRVSALIAAYLEEPGQERLDLQKKLKKLYDARSSAAHGKPRNKTEELVKSFHVLREAVLKMIDTNRVPSQDELEGILFGIKSSDE